MTRDRFGVLVALCLVLAGFGALARSSAPPVPLASSGGAAGAPTPAQPVGAEPRVRFDGQCVVRADLTSQAQLDFMLTVSSDPWSEAVGVGVPARVTMPLTASPSIVPDTVPCPSGVAGNWPARSTPWPARVKFPCASVDPASDRASLPAALPAPEISRPPVMLESPATLKLRNASRSRERASVLAYAPVKSGD